MVRSKAHASKPKRGITDAYWKKSALLVGPFVLGIVLAVVHDTIYSHFDKEVVQSTTQQEWLGRIGTGLAFLVKICFSASIGVACVQKLWWSLRNKSTSMRTVDSSLSVVHNPLTLLQNFRLFNEAPIILSLAVVSWMMPIAASIGPATLTVRQNSQQGKSAVQRNVPAINFTERFDLTYGGYDSFTMAQPALQRLALQVAIGNQPLPFTPPGSGAYLNSSYTLDFYGPCIQCQNASQSWYDAALDAASQLAFHDEDLWYSGWVPYNSCAIATSTGLYNGTNLTEYVINPISECSQTPTYVTVDEFSSDSAHIFVGTFNITDISSNLTNISILNNTMSTEVLAVYDCSLYNASYSVQFQFTNGKSSYSVQNKTIINPVSMSNVSANVVADPIEGRSANNSTDIWSQVTGTWNTPGRAYISMMDALGRVLIGTISTLVNAYMIEANTIITKTPLTTTKDFSKLLSGYQLGEDSGSTNKSLGTAVEELMMNMTMSLFSDPQYLAEYPMVNISVLTNQATYQYSRWQLLTAYGIGALFTLLAVAVGFWCIHINGASYSNNFSTIIRVTRDSNFEGIIRDKDTSGFDPTPSYMKDWKIKLLELSQAADGDRRYAISTSQRSSDETINDSSKIYDDEIEEVPASQEIPGRIPLIGHHHTL